MRDSPSEGLRSKILTAKFSKMRVVPKAFTEKGLYMLATILKGPKAIQTTVELNLALLKVKRTVKKKHPHSPNPT